MDAKTLSSAAALFWVSSLLLVPHFINRPVIANRIRSGPCHRKARADDYLFPDERRYPVPTKACARTALTYAAWSDNLYDAPEVVKRLFQLHPEYRFDRKLATQAKKLLDKYHRAFRERAAA